MTQVYISCLVNMAILLSSRQQRWRAGLHLLRLACEAAPDDAVALRARGTSV